MGAPADPRASLAALAASEPEQAGLIYFDEHQARWRWHPWRWLEEAVREAEGSAGRAGDTEPHQAAVAAVEDAGAPVWPSVEGLVDALALPARERSAASTRREVARREVAGTRREVARREVAGTRREVAGTRASREEAGTCADASTRADATPLLPSGPGRPIALLAAEPAEAEPAAFLAWALAAGAALVVPAAPELLAWSIAWTRPTHLAVAAGDLPDLREALLRLEKPRALRRRLRRLRHLVVWGAGTAPDVAEAAGWAELGLLLTPWPAE